MENHYKKPTVDLSIIDTEELRSYSYIPRVPGGVPAIRAPVPGGPPTTIDWNRRRCAGVRF